MDIAKSIEITDAHIQFVSLVDKAANKKRFLITKQEDGAASFTNYGRILKVDDAAHYVTGVVYEPMAADAHDNYMTEAEIEKAAHWYLKNAGNVDIQHSFEPTDGASVVESWVAKADSNIEGQEVRKGTWLMTMEIDDPDIWDAIKKGEITGLSMGGVGKYAAEETELAKDEAAPEPEAAPDATADEETVEKRGILSRIAHFFGIEPVEKGEMKDAYIAQTRAQNLFTAFDALQHVLLPVYDGNSDSFLPNPDENQVREALSDFNNIVVDLLSMPATVSLSAALRKACVEADKEESVEKAGRKMSKANRDKLRGICQSLMQFLKDFDDPDDDPDDPDDDPDDIDERRRRARRDPDAGPDRKEEVNMTQEEVKKMIDEAVQEEVAKALTPATEAEPEPVEKAEETGVSEEAVMKMIEEAVAKAFSEHDAQAAQTEESEVEKAAPAPEESIEDRVNAAVTKAMQARGVPTGIEEQPVAKQEPQHYLHGLL